MHLLDVADSCFTDLRTAAEQARLVASMHRVRGGAWPRRWMWSAVHAVLAAL
jgi:hypothetical protein